MWHQSCARSSPTIARLRILTVGTPRPPPGKGEKKEEKVLTHVGGFVTIVKSSGGGGEGMK